MSEKTYQEIELSRLTKNPWNRREEYPDPDFNDLVESIRTKGVIVPIMVRPYKVISAKKKKPGDIYYEIVAGCRRYRASCEVAKVNGGMDGARIPAIVKEMSDDDAFDVFVIENLQRRNISELEEAQNFKEYVDRKGKGKGKDKDTIAHLAERIGKDPRYISRRIHVLGLPKQVLKAWEAGTIMYGHCEQLVRLKDDATINKFFKDLMNPGTDWHNGEYVKRDIMTVRDLQRRINREAIALKHAKFDLEGCGACGNNSDVQKSLLDDVTGLAEAICMDPKCFKKRQAEWLKENWKKYAKQIGTNGFRFSDELEFRGNLYNKNHNFEHTDGKPGEKCADCPQFISSVNLDGKFHHKKICIGDRKCFDEIVRSTRKQSKKEKSSGNGSGAGETDSSQENHDEPRVAWHGRHFREEHYKKRIPEIYEGLDIDDRQVLLLILVSLFELNSDLREQIVKKPGHGFAYFEDYWQVIEKYQPIEIKTLIKKSALQVIMDASKVTADERHAIATFLGSDLQREWRINQDYLDKKTTKEMLHLGEQLGIFADEKAQTFVHEILGKKRGKFTGLKKGELIRVFLESGVDLAGKVPKEILDVRTPQEKALEPGMKVCPICHGDCYIPSEEDPENEIDCPECDGEGQVRTCRICGCTEKHACEGGCSWVAPDLCSACEEKEKS